MSFVLQIWFILFFNILQIIDLSFLNFLFSSKLSFDIIFSSVYYTAKCLFDTPHRSISCSFNNSFFCMSYTNDFLPVSNSSWLTLMCMQTIQSKKETNYHSYNYCILFCSSMASVIAFREKTIIRKRRYSILIVQQFPYIRFLVRSCRYTRK